MLRKLLLLVVLLHAGCTAAMTTQPDQAEATRIVWVQQYGVTMHDPPPVQWVTGGGLTCNNKTGWTLPVGDAGAPTCVAGAFYPDSWLAQVAWPTGTEAFSTTAFAHELCHALEELNSNGTEDDQDHTGPCFEPNGGYTQLANEALAKAGL